MQITFLTRKFRNRERNLHCDVVHITTKWVSCLTLDCNGVFAIKAYGLDTALYIYGYLSEKVTYWLFKIFEIQKGYTFSFNGFLRLCTIVVNIAIRIRA